MNSVNAHSTPSSSKEGLDFVKTAPVTEATNSQRTKSISFSEQLEFTQETLSLDDYSEKEMTNAWYNSEDYLAFKVNTRLKAEKICARYSKFVASVEQAYSTCDDVASEMGEDEAAMKMTLLKRNIVSFNRCCWVGSR